MPVQSFFYYFWQRGQDLNHQEFFEQPFICNLTEMAGSKVKYGAYTVIPGEIRSPLYMTMSSSSLAHYKNFDYVYLRL